MKSILYFGLGLLACRMKAWNASPADALIAEDHDREAGLPVAVGFNAGTLPEDPDQWIKVSSYGEWRDGSPQRYLQVFGLEQATEMAAAFNSIVGKVGRLLRGAPIYIGHPDQQPELYTDHSRIGKVVKLEARNDGLYALPKWNDKGLRNLEQGYHVYPSSTWYLKRQAPGESKVYPQHFKSLGLTNFPAGDVEPVTLNADLHSGGDANEETQIKIMDPKLLEMLGLEEGASIEDALAALQALREVAAGAEGKSDDSLLELTKERDDIATERDEEKEKRETAENALVTLQGELAETAINSAVSAGSITKAEVDGWKTLFGKDHATAMNAITALKPGTRLNTDPVDLGGAKPGVSNDFAMQTAFNAAVNKAFEENGGNYSEAWNAVSHSEEFSTWRKSRYATAEADAE